MRASATIDTLPPFDGVLACSVKGGDLVTVARSRASERINAIVNHPDVRPHIGPGGELDLSAAVADPANWFLMGDHGGFALINTAPGEYEVHTFILKSGRGRWARQAAKDGIAFARSHGAGWLWTKIPPHQSHVEAYAREMGMTDTGKHELTFGIPYRIFGMNL